MKIEKEKKKSRKKNNTKAIEAADFLEYDGPYKDDPFKEKEIIIS